MVCYLRDLWVEVKAAISFAVAAVFRKGWLSRSEAVDLCSGFFTKQQERKSPRRAEI